LEVLAASTIRAGIALMMKLASTSETLANSYQTTWYNNLEMAIFIITILRTSNLKKEIVLFTDLQHRCCMPLRSYFFYVYLMLQS
jgi:hypothetical protein